MSASRRCTYIRRNIGRMWGRSPSQQNRTAASGSRPAAAAQYREGDDLSTRKDLLWGGLDEAELAAAKSERSEPGRWDGEIDLEGNMSAQARQVTLKQAVWCG